MRHTPFSLLRGYGFVSRSTPIGEPEARLDSTKPYDSLIVAVKLHRSRYRYLSSLWHAETRSVTLVLPWKKPLHSNSVKTRRFEPLQAPGRCYPDPEKRELITGDRESLNARPDMWRARFGKAVEIEFRGERFTPHEVSALLSPVVARPEWF